MVLHAQGPESGAVEGLTLLDLGRDRLEILRKDRLRIVGWKEDGKSYWISNTLLQSLSSKEMLGVARSMRQYPRK